MDLVIRNGTIVTASETYKADIGVEKGKISCIGKNISKGKEEIDAKGKYVMPGALDVHVHLQLPFCGTVSADSFETGTKAAAAGGVA